jgi:3-dehydroquinate dehydratase II
MTVDPQSLRNPIVLLLNGPNLNLLGSREPQVYGTSTLAEHVDRVRTVVEKSGATLEHVQSNSEGDLVVAVHGARNRCAGIIVNAGALTHYSWSLHDALSAFEGIKIELHLSNTHARETWRHVSVIAPVVHGSIQGFGGHGYVLAAQGLVDLLADRLAR